MLLLSTSSLWWYWIHKIFTFVKKANYDWIDLVIDKTNYDSLDENYLKWLSDEFKLSILSITMIEKGLDRQKIDQVVKIAQTLKSQVINFCPPHFSDKNIDWYFKYLNKIKKETRISISIQNVEQKFMYFIIPEYKNTNLLELKKITWDVTLNITNINRTTWIDLSKAQDMLWNSICNIFISDKTNLKNWLLPWNAWWGLSYLPLESFLMKMKWIWYNWFFTLKIKPKELWVWDNEKVLYNLEQFKKYYQKYFLNFKS